MEDPSNSVQQVDLMNSDDSYDSKDSGDQEQANMIQQSFNVPEYGTSKASVISLQIVNCSMEAFFYYLINYFR